MGDGKENRTSLVGLAAKIKNIEGMSIGVDGKPIMARRKVAFGNKVVHEYEVPVKPGDCEIGHNDKIDDSGKANDVNAVHYDEVHYTDVGYNSNATPVTDGVKIDEVKPLDSKVVDVGDNTSADDQVNKGSNLEANMATSDEVNKLESPSVPVAPSLDQISSSSKNVDFVSESSKSSVTAGSNVGVESKTADQVKPHVSFKSAVLGNNEKPSVKANFRMLNSLAGPNDDYDAMIPITSVKEVSNRLSNSLFGYFLGKRIAFPVVEKYVYNTWAKYGIRKVMMNAGGFYFFKFDSQKGVDAVLENGPWMIRNVPIILKKWSPSVNLAKENLTTVPVWIKMHEVPIAAFTADGLSVIASKVGKPLLLDAHTSTMCTESWGRCSFARAMVEVNASSMLKNEVIIAIPKLDEEGYIRERIRIEYEWKPPQCLGCKIFGHEDVDCPSKVKSNLGKDKQKTVGSNQQGGVKVTAGPSKENDYRQAQFKPFRGLVVGNKKKVAVGKPKQMYVPKKNTTEGTSTSNNFDVLNKLDSDGNLVNSEEAKGKKEMTADENRKYQSWYQPYGTDDDDDDVLDPVEDEMATYMEAHDRISRRKN